MTWIDFSDRKKIAIFAVLAVACILFLWLLPSEAWLQRGLGRRGNVPLPAWVGGLWISGWFFGLFLRAQDKYLTYGFDYGRLYRGCALAGAALGFWGGLLLAFRHWFN